MLSSISITVQACAKDLYENLFWLQVTSKQVSATSVTRTESKTIQSSSTSASSKSITTNGTSKSITSNGISKAAAITAAKTAVSKNPISKVQQDPLEICEYCKLEFIPNELKGSFC